MISAVRHLPSEKGDSSEFAPINHAHDVEVGPPEPFAYGNGAPGSGTSVALAGHVHPCPKPPPPMIVKKGPAKAGSSGVPADAAHEHDIQIQAPIALTYGPAKLGTSPSVAASDHGHEVKEPGQPSAIRIGPGKVGDEDAFAHGNHEHTVTAGMPIPIGSECVVGSSTEVAASNHGHAHGDHPGGTLHAEVTSTSAGFMSVLQNAKLDGIATNAAALGTAMPTQVGGGLPRSGVSKLAAAEDHAHKIAFGGAPGPITNNIDVEGTSETAAHADHGHKHGELAGGKLHALASEQEAGFMSPAEKRAIIEQGRQLEQLRHELERMKALFRGLGLAL